ncbi:MAG: DUF1565 domain-containing protein [Gammaproteobacteria bacterium]|nr:DUF1565 domain-containing protein [Gammaproteobacteria bacterium]
MKLRLILLCLLASPSFAADYYVTPNGNDGSPGSKAQPWKTISKANQVLQPGDTVYVAPGEYRERIEPVRSGQSGKYRGGPTKSDSGISGALQQWARDCPRSKEHETTPP